MPSFYGPAMVWLCVVCLSLTASTAVALQDAARQQGIARYLASRNGSGIACLYTFDRFRPSVNVSGPRERSASDQDDALLVTIPPTFEDHVGTDCPFGDLQFDPELVTNVRNTNSTSEQGVHLAEDPMKDVKRPQIASTDVVPAKEFYSATTVSQGFSFEFSYRRRVETNQTMTLFSIGNRFGSCVDPGFRVDLIPTHVIMVNYFIPVLVGNDMGCYERRLFSARINRCVMPRFRPNIDDNPVVHVIITFDPIKGPGALQSSFFFKYVDPVTMQVYECSGRDSMQAPEEDVEYDYIQGTYRLFIGNNPRNVSSPLKRSRVAPVRQYRDPNWDDRPAEEKLRDMIKQKLNALTGPRLPASFRLFGGKSLSMSFFTVSLPPVNEDTPFKWARDAIADFKEEHGDDIVDFIVNSLRDGKKESSFGTDLPMDDQDHKNQSDSFSAQNAQGDSINPPRATKGIYPNANGSTFDIFHFSLYRKPVTLREVERNYWKTWMTPFRPFMELKKTIRILEDQEVELELLQLHSIFDDIKLEITQLPKLGKVLLHPNKTVLTSANLAGYRELPMDQQQKIYFKPNPGENQKNVRGGGIGRQLDPYSVIRYRVCRTTSGRPINSSHEVSIEIWVDPIQRTLTNQVLDVEVLKGEPVYLELEGFVDDASPGKTLRPTSRRLGLLNLSALLGMNISGIDSSAASNHNSQSIKVIDLPRFGHLYDRRMENISSRLSGVKSIDINELEPYRIHREWIANRTFSTSLVYIQTLETQDGAVDLLRYQVRAVASAEYSSPSNVKFHLMAALAGRGVQPPAKNKHEIAAIQVDEDSAVTIVLSELDTSQLDSRTQFRIEQIPRHGNLYQYAGGSVQSSSPTVNGSVGSHIDSGSTIVEDGRGRVVYVPEPNYFNVPSDELEELDWAEDSLDFFTYSTMTVQDRGANDETDDTGRDATHDVFGVRSVQVQVVNSPDTLTILPPTVFSTNSSRGEPVHVPVVFEDPDKYSGFYRVTLKSEDSLSGFEFEHTITDDDVLKYCRLKRPCYLIQRANGSFSSDKSTDIDDTNDMQLHYHVKTRSWDPSDIDVEGSKAALQNLLQSLAFRDKSLWTWYSVHTAEFKVTVERSSATNQGKTSMRYYIDFTSTEGNGSTDSLGQALSSLVDFMSMATWLAVLGFVLSNASCCSMGFCCCCSRVRTKKRHEFDEERRRYIEQVVQNDHEYSTLLISLAISLREADLRFVETILNSCRHKAQNERSVMQWVCLKSLMPILEDTFSKIVVHFAVRESESGLQDGTFAYPSIAGLALTCFCCERGDSWLRNFVQSVLSKDQDGRAAAIVLSGLEDNVGSLPAEIIDVCQKYADFISALGAMDRSEAIHVVLFNHFIGPALWFTKVDSRGGQLSRSQRRTLRDGMQTFVSYGKVHHNEESLSRADDDLMDRYRSLLLDIAVCSSKQRSDHANVDEDSAFFGAGLMNLHIILEGVMPVLEAEETNRVTSQGHIDESVQHDEDVTGELDTTTIHKIKRLLHALNFPITSYESLASSAEDLLSSDPFVWSGFSRDEWYARTHESKKRATPFTAHDQHQGVPKLCHGGSLLAIDVSQDEDADSTAFEASRSCGPSEHGQTGCIEFEF